MSPSSPRRMCAIPSCPFHAVSGGRCAAHARKQSEQQREVAQHYDQARGNSATRGYDGKWRRYRTSYLLAHPWCEACGIEPARVIDHMVRVESASDPMFWRHSNHWALCDSCNSLKGHAYDGWHGNKVKPFNRDEFIRIVKARRVNRENAVTDKVTGANSNVCQIFGAGQGVSKV